MDGYFAWTWRLFRACFARLAPVYLGAAALWGFVYVALVVFVIAELVQERLEARALAFAALIMLAIVIGTLLAAIAVPVFIEQLTGTRVGSDEGWRRVKPVLGHVIVSALYVAMPMLLIGLFIPDLTQLFLLPAVLGPPVVVQAIVWERLRFRDAGPRAKNLFSGHWGRVLSALLVLSLGPVLVQLAVLPLIGTFFPDSADGDLATSVWASLVIALTSAPVWLFTAAAGTTAYLDLRARFEELDHAALATEARAPREAPSQG